MKIRLCSYCGLSLKYKYCLWISVEWISKSLLSSLLFWMMQTHWWRCSGVTLIILCSWCALLVAGSNFHSAMFLSLSVCTSEVFFLIGSSLLNCHEVNNRSLVVLLGQNGLQWTMETYSEVTLFYFIKWNCISWWVIFFLNPAISQIQ
jgi:hypothetical protein